MPSDEYNEAYSELQQSERCCDRAKSRVKEAEHEREEAERRLAGIAAKLSGEDDHVSSGLLAAKKCVEAAQSLVDVARFQLEMVEHWRQELELECAEIAAQDQMLEGQGDKGDGPKKEDSDGERAERCTESVI